MVLWIPQPSFIDFSEFAFNFNRNWRRPHENISEDILIFEDFETLSISDDCTGRDGEAMVYKKYFLGFGFVARINLNLWQFLTMVRPRQVKQKLPVIAAA